VYNLLILVHQPTRFLPSWNRYMKFVSYLICHTIGCVGVFAQTEVSERAGPDIVHEAPVTADTLRIAPSVGNHASPASSRDSTMLQPLRVELRNEHIVAFSVSGPLVVTVYDVRGGVWAQKVDERGQLAIDVPLLPHGHYIVTAMSEGHQKSITLLK